MFACVSKYCVRAQGLKAELMTNEVKDISMKLKQKESQIKLINMMNRGRLQSSAMEPQLSFSSDTEPDQQRMPTLDTHVVEKAAKKLMKVLVCVCLCTQWHVTYLPSYVHVRICTRMYLHMHCVYLDILYFSMKIV